MENKNVRSHFDKLAEEGVWASLYREPGAKVTSETFSFLIRARRIIELLQSRGRGPGEVLDIGCGTAPIAESLVAMGAHYTGSDFSPQMIAAATQNVAKLVAEGSVTLNVGDVTKLTYPDDSFDVVTAMGVAEYLTRDDLSKALHEVRRVLRPGGVALLTIPKRLKWETLVLGLLYPLRKVIRTRPYRKNIKLEREEEFRRLYLSSGELDRSCRQAGLRKINQRHYNFEFLCRPATLVAPRLCYLVNRPFEGLTRIPGFTFFATGYIGMYSRE